ncbi:two-component regulator propeller domain-containing protein [Hymenobacter cellulosivorans]|uniref:histidine kinase n=1 Tax=Hymenobacter cellulosivorans TaxID=2932249 RepID=A0ABY4FFD8_9BACT|nr:two-component regulator propeller domain-containing protein [Hymenobacter cellulosivorans]UOQ54841.1 ATP-binding protein [Hymenobacter cellulosivorans]
MLLRLLTLLVLLGGAWAAGAQTLATRVYTLADGLPQSTVYALAQDDRGQLWAGTQGGVGWFDGHRFQSLDTHQGLPDNHVTALLPSSGHRMRLGHYYGALSEVDSVGKVRLIGPQGWRAKAPIHQLLPAAKGGVWAVTSGDGLYRLPGTKGGTGQHFTRAQGLPCDTLNQVAAGPGGQLWLATPDGLGILDTVAGQIVPAPAVLARQRLYSIYRVSAKAYWVGLANGLGELTQTAAGWQLRIIGVTQGLCPGPVLRVLADHRGRVWTLAAAGISRYEPRTGRAVSFPQTHLLSDQTGNSLLEDREGNLWAALDDGILQHIADERFTLYGAEEGMSGGTDVQALVPISPGLYWVATRNGLWELRPGAPAGQRLRPGYRRPGGAEANFIRALFRDKQGRVWLGSRGAGAAFYDPATGQWQELNKVPGLVRQNVRHFAQDRLGRVWAVTGGGGATVILNPTTGESRTYGATSGLGSNEFWAAFQDRQGTLWLGSDDRGLIRVEPQANGADEFQRAPGQPARLSIGHITEDPRGQLWLGSIGSGLLRYDGQRLRSYGPEVGLHSNNPYFAEADAQGRIWLGTEQGLEVFDPTTRRTTHYGLAEGFLGQETNQGAVLIEPDGQVWAGTINGLMRYNPAGARPNQVPPRTRISGTRVFMQDTVLAGSFELPYALNHLTFDFVGVSLTNPAKVRYQYRLAGFDAHWSRPGSTTFATYTNLPPGQYTFEVKAANNDGVWNPEPARLSFTIGAPWWRSWGAYGLYLLILSASFYAVRRQTQRRERERARQQLEYLALTHLQEMDRVKTDFFTNISHELRTPLTLILGPAEELTQDPAEPVRQQGQRILGNARKLLHLINQLLDLSRLEAGGLALHPQPGDVAAAASTWLAAFEELAAARQVGLHLAVPATPVPLVFDAARLEEVVTNLLANALRFTPAGGHVTLAVRDEPASAAVPGGAVVLSVQDTGVGIQPEHLPHLFDRFYQVPGTAAAATGSGVGLALVKELTERHGGTVQVLSTPGAGTTFVVRLPRQFMSEKAGLPSAPEVKHEDEVQLAAAVTLQAETAPAATEAPSETEAEVVLVVDDSAEVREFVQAALASEGYRIVMAASGPEAAQLAASLVPSLVVSDVMMPPGFDGFELCRQLKTAVTTSHIPVVLLTARATATDRIEGLETGADAYLTKPFAPRELRAQVRNLLALRRRVGPELAAPEPSAPESFRAYAAAVAALPSLDQTFLTKVEEAVEQHLDNGEFSVEMLSEEVALSRAQLHRKLKALTGQAPSDFIRSLRLRRAHVLLAARAGSVSEIAYQVGFNSPAHFSTSFSKQFGYAPSEVPVMC